MRTLADNINKIPGLRFVIELLELQSPVGRQQLSDLQWMNCEEDIYHELNKVTEARKIISNESWHEAITLVLHDIRDIAGTITALQCGVTLDTLGLFEIKRFALLSEKLRDVVAATPSAAIVNLYNLQEVIQILDPEKQGLPHFYLYDHYSNELADLRKKLSATPDSDQHLFEELKSQIAVVENNVCRQISERLHPYASELSANLQLLGKLDLWLAKAKLATRYNFCKPKIGYQLTVYRQLFNPVVAKALADKGKEFQPVDISLHYAPSVVTGANMGGKTVLLKTLALAQYLFQYGFYVPAQHAVIVPVEEVFTSYEDEQSELHGLSSFAAEMLKINSIVHAARSAENILALIDEPARTTNPQEGEAIVNALVDLLQQYHVRSVVTTHFSGIDTSCPRLRIKGLKTELLSVKHGISQIHDLMDYSLMEVYPDSSNEYDAPHEAFRIAELLDIDEELLHRSAVHFERKMFNTEAGI